MEVIHKDVQDLPVKPNLDNYEQARAAFSWAEVMHELGADAGRCNIGYLAVDRHLEHSAGDRTALRFLDAADPTAPVDMVLTYADLAAASRRFTGVLRRLGVGRDDRMFMVCDRTPELYTGMMGALRNGTVVAPLFAAFGPDPLATRLRIGAGTILLTTEPLYRRKIAKIRDMLPDLRHVLLVGTSGTTEVPDTLDLRSLLADTPESDYVAATTADDPALLHFTSGTTGTPKGAVHVHGAVATHFATGRYALDLHPDDTFWCTADPGWVTGTSYGVIAPLLHGVGSIVDPGDFDAGRWYRILQDHAVTVWYTAPTAVRMLIKAGGELAHEFSFPRLRFIASVGEPLNPEAVVWGKQVLGLPIHDNWWQTETGGIMIANTPAFDIKPGSMGRPLPGVDACIVHRENGRVERVEGPDAQGELALTTGWPSMFRGYLHDDARYRNCFADDPNTGGRLYLTGDLARRDADGYFWFVGRADDVIKSSGHLIGPIEVENILTEHPAVAEAAVIGKPDELAGELVKAFVTVRHGFHGDEKLRQELIGLARRRLGAAVAPKEIEFADTLPHTRSGKIMRRLLKARELGLPEGDTSTLEVSR